MTPGEKDQIVQAINAPEAAGLWQGKILGHPCTLYIFQPFLNYPRSIVWEITKRGKSLTTGQSVTVWDAIDTIEQRIEQSHL